jgi:DNA-binding CsgD family transcriptional regulator
MENYKLDRDSTTGGLSKYARRLSDGVFVHTEKNEEYLAWLAEGNTPQPAD